MNAENPLRLDPQLAGSLANIELRLARLEERVGLPAHAVGADFSGRPPGRSLGDLAAAEAGGEEMEFVVGQNWFAGVGILVLTLGAGLTLSLPFASLPPFVPSVAGCLLAGALFIVARLWRKSFALVTGYFRGAGLALLYLSALRLFFFGQTHVLDIESTGGRALLIGVVAVMIAVALRQKSPWLLAIGIMAGSATGVLVGAPWLVFAGNILLAGLAVFAAVRFGWPGLVLLALSANCLSHLLWTLNRPWQGRVVQLIHEPVACIYVILAYAAILAAGPGLRRDRTTEDPLAILTSMLICAGVYGLLLVQTFGVPATVFVPAHLAAALVFLGLAIVFWRREASRVATFFYAMTGYLALTVALLRVSPVPDIFLWLSLQSLVVVTTALWFRSRLIVVANFFIFAGIVVSYVVTTTHEEGISLGFGVVALLTARILHWQQRRLELTTELMRNTYLASAFIVFPYALFHLVPRAYVGVSWVGVAVAYYLMNLVVRSPKYRWLGHLTLLLTVLYVLVVGITQLTATYRIISFMVLGTVLLVVSLLFTRARAARLK